ncbi:MAG: L,D-transpeptidase [Hyphomicrobiales bacterium]|nr:L,D-transpeptidase [Hyphomicrobiales bacterium]MDE2113243.1 L,D-transpeptidase [Hyphomicrobiales bacterium]
MHRRLFLLSGAAALGGCATSNTTQPSLVSNLLKPALHTPAPAQLAANGPVQEGVRDMRPGNLLAGDIPAIGPFDKAVYAGMPHDIHPIPPLDFKRVNKAFLRSVVLYPTKEVAGTIVISPKTHFLYLILGDGRAIRYGVGVGRAGFAWSGTANVHFKREWPKWFPPPEMIARDSRLRQFKTQKFMPGGINNPLGARAHYLWQGDKDTYYRVHGTNEPESIGLSMSSGCIRMHNLDVVDLYSRTSLGCKVIVEA